MMQSQTLHKEKMENQFDRLKLLIGQPAIDKLRTSAVAVFGIGGVGGFTAEALARSGVGKLILIDKDVVSLTNLNRQIIALHSSIGRYKVDVMKERILDINPDAQVETRKCFFLPDNSGDFDFKKYDYVADCVDTVTAKLQIIRCAKMAGIPVISSMGTAGKLDPGRFRAADISQTSCCPLAKVMRRELKARGIKDVKVVFSTEERTGGTVNDGTRHVPGSSAFCPSAAGLMIASQIVQDLTL